MEARNECLCYVKGEGAVSISELAALSMAVVLVAAPIQDELHWSLDQPRHHASFLMPAKPFWVDLRFSTSNGVPLRQHKQHRKFKVLDEMTSMKRAHPGEGAALNLSSKVYVRTTRNGKVQKIVREVYLRKDIPCSSKLCTACLSDAPTSYQQKSRFLRSSKRNPD